MSFDERIAKLKLLQRGWGNYFKLGNIGSKLKSIDSWTRNRLRYCIWTDWKKPERKRKNLIRLGVPPSKAYQFSRTRKGGCTRRAQLAPSPIMVTTITLERLRKRGYESMNDYYEKVSPMFNERGRLVRCIRDPYVQWCDGAGVPEPLHARVS